MEKKSEISEQNFTEGKVLHYLCSVMLCLKLSFMIKKFEKRKEVMVLTFLNLVLKKYGKWFFLNVWEPWLPETTMVHFEVCECGKEISNLISCVIKSWHAEADRVCVHTAYHTSTFVNFNFSAISAAFYLVYLMCLHKSHWLSFAP